LTTSRRHGRELALKTLYGTEVGHRPVDEMLAETCVRVDEGDGRTFVRELVRGTLDGVAQSDELIAPLLQGWTLERLPTIDRILLRMAVFELLHCYETPVPVVINEAVELAKKFSTEDSGRFINGVLSRAAKLARGPLPEGAPGGP
jgi:N utilization substance protein B